MIRFLFQKIINKKWLLISLIIGYILLIAIAASHPMYKDASLQRMLTDEFENVIENKNMYPALITLRGTADKGNNTEFNTLDDLSRTVCDKLSIDLYQRITHFYIASTKVTNVLQRTDNIGYLTSRIGFLSDLEDNIQMITGEIYSDKIGEDGFIEAIVSQNALITMNIIVGEELIFENLLDKNGDPIKIRIVGVYENNGVNNDYWVNSPDSYNRTCMIDEDLFRSLFLGGNQEQFVISGVWYIQPDYTTIKPEQVSTILTLTDKFIKQYFSRYSMFEASGYVDILNNFGHNEKKISVTLMILQVPVIVLLCAFIYMISGQMLQLEQNEISQLKSRGASRLQILSIYILQSLFLGVISFAIGIPLGSYLCRVIGSSNAFLEFVQRRPLQVKITPDVILYGIVALTIAVLVTVIPVIKYSKVSIVQLKQKSKSKTKPIWQRLYLDVVVLLVSLYGLYVFNNQKEELAKKVLSGEALDPLLFLSSSLFILGAGLLALRLQPLFIKLLFMIGKKIWKPANYVSFLPVLRTGSKQYFIMIFLILTVALGMFYATIARTILANTEENLRYKIGSDIVIKEVWNSNEDFLKVDPSIQLQYDEPDFNRFWEIDGVDSVAKVYTADSINVSLSKNNINAKVMAIDTKEFGETTDVKSDILPIPYRQYLNTLAKNPNAVLVSSNFKKLGLKVGDRINFSNYKEANINATVFGFFDYWPSYIPKSTVLLDDGTAEVRENYLIISHFSTTIQRWGLRPYEVWVKMDGPTSSFYNYVTDNNLKLSKYLATDEELKDIRNETLFQGTNGILTLSFIVILLLCSVGFLIYWILSIRSRELLFGVFRAMGMSRREIIHMLINEQLFTGLYSIIIGTVIGHLASSWYVPLIQIAYAAADQILPLELITELNDMIRLFIVIGVVFVSCIAILIRLIFKMKIAQALKLGED